jgi:hypothetical protein
MQHRCDLRYGSVRPASYSNAMISASSSVSGTVASMAAYSANASTRERLVAVIVLGLGRVHCRYRRAPEGCAVQVRPRPFSTVAMGCPSNLKVARRHRPLQDRRGPGLSSHPMPVSSCHANPTLIGRARLHPASACPYARSEFGQPGRPLKTPSRSQGSTRRGAAIARASTSLG